MADLEAATTDQVPLTNTSPFPVGKGTGGGTSGWSVCVGYNGVCHRVVLDVPVETIGSDLKWHKEAQTGIRIVARGSSLLTLVWQNLPIAPEKQTFDLPE